MPEFDDMAHRTAHVEYVQIDGDEVVAVILEGEGVAVPVLLVCRSLGIDSAAQIDRLREHDVMARGLRFVKAPIGSRLRSVVAILHTHIPMWLALINPADVNAESRPKLIKYQEELVIVLDALYSPFAGAALTPAAPPALGDPQQALIPTEAPDILPLVRELRAMRDSLLALAQHQQTHDDRLGTVENVVEELRQIIPVTPVQAEYLLRAIKRLALRIEQRTPTTTNMYSRLFAQFKLDMGIHEYKALPYTKYDAALAWLRAAAATWLPDDPDALPPLQERLL